MSIKLPKIFLDSGDPEETKKAKGVLGFLDGQTTNPSLVAKHPEVVKFLSQGKKMTEKELLDFYRQIIKDVDKEIAGPISVEVYADWHTKAPQMLKQAEEMFSWGKNIYIKLPALPEGLKAAKEFVQKGGRVNMTLVFDQNQAAAAYSATLPFSNRACPPRKSKGRCGRAFVSPFVGRWDDRGLLGLDLVKNIIKMYKKFDKKNRRKNHILVLAASIRNLDHFYGSIALKTDIVTIPLKIIYQWIEAEKWIPDNNYRINTCGLKSIKYEDSSLKAQLKDYQIRRIKGSLLDEGLQKFVSDWKNLIE